MIRNAMWGKDVIETCLPVRTIRLQQVMDASRKYEMQALSYKYSNCILQPQATDPEFFRFLYNKVGAPWKWVFYRDATRETLLKYLANKQLYLLVDGSIIGFALLEAESIQPDSCVYNISYFGLFPEYTGKGYGKSSLYAVLEHIAKSVADPAPVTVWLYTTSTDHPNALKTYQSVGFDIVKYGRDQLWVPSDMMEPDSEE